MSRLDVSTIRAKDLGRVAVLFGGESAERDISIRSGEGVLSALKRQGADAFGFDPSQRRLQDLQTEATDRVFIALHGRYGEDGTVQGALELMKIPYTGSGVMASSVAMDKAMTKRIWSTFNLPTPSFTTLEPEFDPIAVSAALGLPIAVKPTHEGSSLGFTKVVRTDELIAAYDKARQYDSSVLAESFVQGREFTCALLQVGNQTQALPVIEIVAPDGDYDYQNKYFGNATRYLCPAPIDFSVESRMRALSIAAFNALGCAGWARADLMWNGQGEPMLLEINTSPGMTDHSLVPMAAKQAGIEYDDLVMTIAAGASCKLGKSR